MHIFYNSNNDVLIGTTFSNEDVKFKKVDDNIFTSLEEFNIFNPKKFGIILKNGYNKLSEEQITKIKKLTQLDFSYDFSSGIKIGHVTSCETHPDSDHMHVLKVDVGNDILDIVCGASNIRKDLYVAVATPGSYVENLNLFIKPSKLRGILSNGMICSKYELGLVSEKQKGIWEITNNTNLGTDVFTI